MQSQAAKGNRMNRISVRRLLEYERPLRERLSTAGLRAITAAGMIAALASGAVAGSFQINNGSASGITFDAASVAAQSGSITQNLDVVYNTNLFSQPSANSSFTITFTLPAGVTFAKIPQLAITGSNCFASGTETPTNSSVGTSTATFDDLVAFGTSSSTPPLGACQISLFNIQLNGATALEAPNSAGFLISASISVNGTTPLNTAPGLNDDVPAYAQLAQSANSLTVSTLPAMGSAPVVIDLAAPNGPGFEFSQGGTDSVTADIGAIVVTNNALAQANGTAGNGTLGSLSNPPNFSVSLTGSSWAGLTGSFMLQAGSLTQQQPCANATGTKQTGTVSGNTLTFGGLTTPPATAAGTSVTQYFEVCLVAPGNTLIQANPAITAAVTDAPSFVKAGGPLTALNGYTYNGLVQTVSYAVANNSSYQSFFSLTNSTANSITVNFRLVSDQGTTATGSEQVAANSLLLLPASTIVPSNGFLSATGRFSPTFFVPGVVGCTSGVSADGSALCPVVISQVLLNPDGTVVALGSGSAP
jgi:hypothetical protein